MRDVDYITWLEQTDWAPFRQGERVMYAGAMLNAHGLWVVHAQTGDDRYVLCLPDDSTVRLNAKRQDLTREVV